MPLYIFDTDSVTFQQAGRETIIRRLQSVPADSVYTTVTILLSVNGVLITINRRDFDNVPGLIIEDWNT